MDIQNEEENIGNLKQLNLTLFCDKSLLQIVPRKHFLPYFQKKGGNVLLTCELNWNILIGYKK